jgi:hypothetical protein
MPQVPSNQPVEVIGRIIDGPRPRPSLSRKGIGEEVDQVFLRALARDREDRYGTASELLEALTASLGSLHLADAPIDFAEAPLDTEHPTLTRTPIREPAPLQSEVTPIVTTPIATTPVAMTPVAISVSRPPRASARSGAVIAFGVAALGVGLAFLSLRRPERDRGVEAPATDVPRAVSAKAAPQKPAAALPVDESLSPGAPADPDPLRTTTPETRPPAPSTRRAPRPTIARAAPAAPTPVSPLRRLLAEARASHDLERLKRLAGALEAESARIADPRLRDRIKRSVLSAQLDDLDAVEQTIVEIERAR